MQDSRGLLVTFLGRSNDPAKLVKVQSGSSPDPMYKRRYRGCSTPYWGIQIVIMDEQNRREVGR